METVDYEVEERVEQMAEIQSEAIHLFEKKNRDYGDAFAEYGPVGVIVRMGDKIKRLMSISNKGVTLVNTESLRDTLLDLHNYAAMAIMTLDDEESEKTFS
jgi:predicted amino acid racemase